MEPVMSRLYGLAGILIDYLMNMNAIVDAMEAKQRKKGLDMT